MMDRVRACEDRTLSTRIISEYLEMPGLRLTMRQACRLWNVDAERCDCVLQSLLVSGFLKKSGDSYVRAHDGRRAA
jgi:hypothetical protein